MEIGFVLSILALIFGLLGMILFIIGTSKEMFRVSMLGVAGLYVTAAIAIGVSICILQGSAQLWKTSELEKITKAKPEPHCYIFGESKLCGEFIYEDKNFRYINKNDTMTIENKEKN